MCTIILEDEMRLTVRRGNKAAYKPFLAAAFGLTALTLAPLAAQAETPATAVTLDVREARLEDAVQLLTKQTGVDNVVFVNVAGKAFGVVTVKMTDQPFEKVLRAMAASAEAVVSLEDNIYYIRPRGAEAEVAKPQTATAVSEVAPVRKRSNQVVAIPMQFLIPSAFKKMLDTVGWQNMAEQDPLLSPLEAEMKKSRQSNMETAQPQLAPVTNPFMPPAANTAVGEGLSAGRDGGDSAGQRGGLPGGGQGLGGGIGGGGRGGQGQGGQGGQAGGFLPDGVEQIISYDANNTLLVRGDTEGIEELRAIIRLLDVAPKQVNIKVEFVQLNINDSDAFGIDWQFKFANNIDTFIPAQGGSATTLAVAVATGNTVANLRASLIRNTGNLIQSPIISTTNNTPASLNFSSEQPVFNEIVIPANGFGGTPLRATQISSVPVSNGLSVVPHINGDNSISMGISPILSRFQTVSGPNGAQAIARTQQTLTTYRRVQSGETILLGGFITQQESRQIQETPFLSKLPIIGSLFTQRTRTNTAEEVLVFLTPTIIDDRSQGTTGAGSGQLVP